MNLYTVSNEYLSILQQFEETEGEVTQNDIEKLKALDALSTTIQDKAINMAAYIKNMEAEYSEVAKARKDMQAREKRLADKLGWLEDYLKINLQKCGISEIKTSPYFVIKVKKCPVSVNIIDELKIPVEYKQMKEVISINKSKLKEDMQEGLYVEGAELQQNMRLEIK